MRPIDASDYSYWPTADAAQGGRVQSEEARAAGTKAQIGLGNVARNWQTPNAAAEAPNLGSNIKNGPKSLLAQAEQTTWPTPRASYNENRTTQDAPSHGVTHGATLAGTAGSWATPVEQRFHIGPPAQTTPMPGDESLPSGQTLRRRLNPRFAEWLMGWPEGWVEVTNFTS